MNYRECYERGCSALNDAGIEEATLDARLLLEHVCGTNRNDLLVHGDRPVEPEKEEQYLQLIARRSEHIPLQHLTGVQDFMGLEFQVNEHVLIPRQDTEVLVEEVLKELHDGMHILDMCTGSGCILISLLHYSNDCSGVGVDISEEALQVARTNSERILSETNFEKLLGSDGVTENQCWEAGTQDDGVATTQATFLRSNLFENVTGKYEIIVSNPPYICSNVIPTLMPEVKEHEPMQALDGMADGLFFYRKIVEESRNYLTGGGMLYFEIGYDQAEAVSGLMQDAGFAEINVVKDYAGLDRVVYGTLVK